MRTTAPDFARFLTALMAGEVVSSELLAEVFSDDASPVTVGGFFTPDFLCYPGQPFYGFTFGDVSGYSIELIVDPDSGDIAMVLTNNLTIGPLPVVDAIVDAWEAEAG